MSTKQEFREKLTELTQAHLEDVSGGAWCSAADVKTWTEELVTIYENAIDATSHIIERVANATGP